MVNLVVVYPESTGSLINETKFSYNSKFRRLASIQKTATLNTKYVFLENVRKVFSIFTEFYPDRILEEAVYYLKKLPKVIYGVSNEDNVLVYCFAAVDITLRSKGRFLRKDIIDDILDIYGLSTDDFNFSKDIKKAKSIIITQFPELRRRNRSNEIMNIIRGEAISIAIEMSLSRIIPEINTLCNKLSRSKTPWKNLELLGLSVFIQSIPESSIRKEILKKFDKEKRKKVYNGCYRIRRSIN